MKNARYSIAASASGDTMGLLDPRYTESELLELEKIQSHINVARAVLETRISKGMTQEEVGRAAGTKQSRISEIEALKGNPRFDTLDRVARVLGLMIALVPRGEPIPSRIEPSRTYQMSLWGEITWECIAIAATSDHMSGAHG